MTLTDFLPKDVSLTVAMALCAVAFVSGTARGFSGFGSALIFMPLASSIAAPRLVAALLLVIDFVAAAPLLPDAWRKADRKATAVIVLGALVGVPVGTYFLSVLEPVTTRWIISCFVARCCSCCCRAGAIAARTTPGCRSASAASLASAAAWPRPAARRSSATGSAARSHRSSRAPTSCCSLVRRISSRWSAMRPQA